MENAVPTRHVVNHGHEIVAVGRRLEVGAMVGEAVAHLHVLELGLSVAYDLAELPAPLTNWSTSAWVRSRTTGNPASSTGYSRRRR